MATKTLKISGNKDGYRIEVKGSTLSAWGRLARKMSGELGLTWEGTYLPSTEDRPAVEEAVRSVMETGKPTTLTIGQPDKPRPVAPEWTSERGLTLTEEMDREDTLY